MRYGEAIAIVGAGCRLPGGVCDPRALAHFLEAHGDGVVDVPADRWAIERFYDPEPDAPGKVYVKRGGFLTQDPFAFDPAPFGISPREAAHLDPQQRLLLEVAWEALDDAGLDHDALRGSRTGVYVGGFTFDRAILGLEPANRWLVDAQTATSMTMTVLSNRLSYTFDFRGPSLTVDTACSSSLVAAHLAARALQERSIDVALVGGVNAMLTSSFTLVMCKGHFLAPDGRSKAFDAAADGYGRGEGAAVLVMKRLSAAIADGDRILAVLRGSAVNQDGRTDGMPLPRGSAQEAVIREVCDSAEIDAKTVGLLEAHGTGTRAGDPVEARALGAVYGRASGRSAACFIGSIKTNIGHLEAAAGVAGLLKAALAVNQRRVLPQRSLSTPNPDIAFGELGLRVALAAEPWPFGDGPARAAVNSFGYGGTNAHIIVEEPAQQSHPTARVPEIGDSRPNRVWLTPISAESAPALRQRAADLCAAVTDAPSLDGIRHTLALRRTHLAQRAAVWGRDRDELASALRALATGEKHAGVVEGAADRTRAPRVVWVFSGMGPQWWGMGRELLASSDVFRGAAERCDAIFRKVAGWSVLDAMRADEATSEMATNRVAQPANLVLQVALVELMRSLGQSPDGYLGHSVGEVAAAWASGALSLEDTVFIGAHRSRIQQRAAGRGTMLAAGLSAKEAEALIPPGADVCIASYNGKTSIAFAGARAALDEIAEKLSSREVFHRFLGVEVAYHSAHMDPLEAEFRETLSRVTPRAPSAPLYSTMTGDRISSALHDAEYWWKNARKPVLLERALEAAFRDGTTCFVEIGPHPALSPSIRAVLDDHRIRGSAIALLRRREPEWENVMRGVGELFVRGATMDWSKLAPSGPRVSLPAYPWQRGRHWIESEESQASRLGRPGAHPLLMTARATAERAWECDLDALALRWLREHQVDGEAVFPGAAYVECALAAQAELRGTRDGETILEQVVFTRALVVARGARNTLSIACDPAEGTFQIASRRDEEPWTSHATGRVARGERWRTPAPLDLAQLRARLDRTIAPAALYEAFEARGLAYGPAFRGIEELALGDGELLATIDLDQTLDVESYFLHPALLDATFQALLGSVLHETNEGPVVPVAIGRVRVLRPAGGRVVCHAVRRTGSEGLRADLVIADPDGEVIVEIAGLECRPVRPTEVVPARWVHVPRWVPAPIEASPVADERERWVIVSKPGDPGDALVSALATSGEVVRLAEADAALMGGATRIVHVVPRAVNAHEATSGLLATVQAIKSSARPQLDIIVQGAYATSADEAPSYAAAAAAGLARVVMTERPALGTRLMDVVDASSSAIARALRAADGEEECALRGDARLALRHARSSLENAARRAVVREQAIGAEPLELVVAEHGKLDALTWRPAQRRSPDPGEIEIEVEAAALNFKDVLKAMGLLSATALERTYLGTGLGMEAAGRVVRVGAGVSGFREGDSVHAYVGGALRTHVTVDTRFVTPRAPGHGAVEASSYFVFATAWYSLVEAGRVRAGERVLIHSAGGGVGLAAVQIATMLGAEVFATAGTEEKRAFVRERGAHHVFDSRTLDFAPEIMRATGGRGVHVVLNSLAEPALSKSLELLTPGGRFVELGKQDIAEGRALSLLPFNRNLTFSAVDLDRLAQETPEYFAPLMRDVLAAFASGRLATLEATVFPASEVVTAFRKLASGRAIGKVVIDLSRGATSVAPGLTPRPVVRADRTYLVTGGTSGFGLETGVWLSERGAGRVVLASRRGSSGEADAVIARLRAQGAHMDAVALDVTDAAAVRELVRSLAQSAAPLAGIFHSAMVLEDRSLADLDAASLNRVLEPKVTGALNLDAATRELPLDCFVVYSSVSAMVGNPGQAAYAAANAAIEAIVRARRAHGLAGLSIAWGALANVGVVARDASVAAHLARLGLTPIDPARALAAMGRLLEEDQTHAGVIDIDWTRWVATNREASWKRLADLVARDAGSGHGGDPLEERLAGLPPEAHPAVIRDALIAAAAAVFRTEATNVDPTRPLKDLGLDSLMAVELQAAFADATGVEIPSMELLGGRSIEALVARVVRDRAAKGERGTRHHEAPREGEALEAHLLSRICVQPPYFALRALRREGDLLLAEASPDGWHPQERGAVGSAEAARHLAILGSAAISLEHPSEERVYYPVHRARLVETGAADLERASVVSLSARSVAIDVARSTATAETELRTLAGELICRFEVDYHLIPEASFRTLFAAHAQATMEATTPESPYGRLRSLDVRFDGDEVVASIPNVEAADCLGHFLGIPAFPVSIMARDAFHLVARGVARRHGEGVLLAVRGGNAETRRFVWAGEEATFRARCIASDGPSNETWRCEISSGSELAAWFEMILAIAPA